MKITANFFSSSSPTRRSTKLFVALAGCGLLVTCVRSWAWQPASPVVVAQVVEREIATGQSFVGTVHPRRRSIIGSAVDGRVIDVLVEAGDWVTKDQPLAQLLTKTLEIERDGAQAEFALRKQELEEMQNGSLPEEVIQAKAKMASAKAIAEYAKSKFERTLSLFRQDKSVTQEELDQAQSVTTAAEQTLVAAAAVYDLSVQGPRKERLAQAEARVAVAQEAVNLLEDRLKKFTIRSPFDGYVVTKFTEVGEWMSQAKPVVEVIELSTVEVHVGVPEQFIGALHAGWAARIQNNEPLTARVQCEAVPNEALIGELTKIVPQADVRSRTFPVKVLVENPLRGESHLLKAGMLARVTLPVEQVQKAMLVPKDALVLGGPTPVVFVVQRDAQGKTDVVQPVPVQLGVADGALIQVIGPIKNGQTIVVRGNERLRPGQTVQVAER